jgi:hypothetical protein
MGKLSEVYENSKYGCIASEIMLVHSVFAYFFPYNWTCGSL